MKIGDKAVCRRGVVGIIREIKLVRGRKLYKGVTEDGENWQTYHPKYERDISYPNNYFDWHDERD